MLLTIWTMASIPQKIFMVFVAYFLLCIAIEIIRGAIWHMFIKTDDD